MKLKYKIAISIAVISLMVLSIVSYAYINMSYKSVMNFEKKKLESIALESSKYIKQELLSNLRCVETMATAPILLKSLEKSNSEFDSKDAKSIKHYIDGLNKRWMNAHSKDDSFVKPYLNNPLALYLKKQQKTLEGVYGEIFVTNKDGALVASTGKLTTLAHAQKYWWKNAYDDGVGKIFFDDRGFDVSVHGYVIGVVLPIKKDGKIIGILKANINIINTLNKVIEDNNKFGKSKLKIVRTKGDVVLEQSFVPLSTHVNPQILVNLQNYEVGSRMIDNANKEMLVAYAPVDISDGRNIGFGGKVKTKGSFKGNDGEIWHSVVTYDKDLALQKSYKTTRQIIFIGLFLTLFNCLMAYLVGRWISKPIEKLQEAQEELKKQEEMMIAQSRHAAMGEMISMIAHQWRQPISVIAMGANNIMADIELGITDEDELRSCAKNISKQTQELSKTIDDFKNFFKPDREKSFVLIKNIFDDVFSVVGSSLKNSDIEVLIEYHGDEEIETYPRELMQVFINILKNAKEAIVLTKATERKISIYFHQTKNGLIIKICDTGGGIKEEMIDKIFNPYFTTKGVGSGTGLGLYMSKTIIQKHLKGTITVHNVGNGACFEIKLPLHIEGEGSVDE